MAVGLQKPGKLEPVAGVRLASTACGIKSNAVADLLLVELAENSVVAGVFTKNAYCAAPVTVAREHLAVSTTRALLINSGNANAGTGALGESDARTLCGEVAAQLSIVEKAVLPFSTGVIGTRLPVDLIRRGIKQLPAKLNTDSWQAAAEAIMTTDTLPKAISATALIDDAAVTITGISKGSGMIHPDMATMLSFVMTDARIDQEALQHALRQIADDTFNCISVDGDTSTNDAYVCAATGCAGNDRLTPDHPQWAEFYQALEEVSRHLAHSIIRDGEGATRFISIEVSGGATKDDCRQAGFTVAHSPLVKTAFFAGDPNLGRILAAIGRSKVDHLDMGKVSLSLGDLPVVERGEPSAQYNEAAAECIMAKEDVTVRIDLGMGSCSTTVWTTDLSYDYVKINAEYRS